jgi:ParB-like chromosome segregation protein Spo0J
MTNNPASHAIKLPEPQLRPIDSLSPAPRNARTHSRKQVRQIADSIRAFGFTNPVLVDGNDQVIAGHGRLAAARLLGLPKVPVLCIDWLSEAQQRAYVIADNRLAEKAGWDRGLLAIELGELCDLEIDETLTGFDLREIELVIDAGDHAGEEHEVPELRPGPAICQPGDLWRLGRHRLLCGDALDHDSYRVLMAREKARLVLTDPPYNVKIQGHVSGLGCDRARTAGLWRRLDRANGQKSVSWPSRN